MIIGSLIFRRPNQINDVKRIENFSTSNTTMCECPFFLEVNLIADIQCLFNDRLESHSAQRKLRYGHQFFRIFKSLLLEATIGRHKVMFVWMRGLKITCDADL